MAHKRTGNKVQVSVMYGRTVSAQRSQKWRVSCSFTSFIFFLNPVIRKILMHFYVFRIDYTVSKTPRRPRKAVQDMLKHLVDCRCKAVREWSWNFLGASRHGLPTSLEPFCVCIFYSTKLSQNGDREVQSVSKQLTKRQAARQKQFLRKHINPIGLKAKVAKDWSASYNKILWFAPLFLSKFVFFFFSSIRG